MATNLVSYIMQLLTPQLIGRVAGALGLDSGKVQSAIAAAVPAILAGLGSLAAQPGGAQKVADAVGEQSASLGDMVGMIGSGNQGTLASSGSQLLSSLFGTADSSALANAVGKYAGLDGNTGSSLMGMLAPLVLGGLGEQSEGDLSPGNMANILASQKSNIAAALPSGFGDLLAGTGLLGVLGGAARSATTAASQTAAQTSATVTSMASAGQRTATQAASGSSRWLYWLIAALVLAVVLYYLFGNKAEKAAAPPSQTTTEQQPAAAPDVGKQLADTLAGLQSTLTGVTDAASATAALPKLQAATGEIDKVQAALGQMTAEQKAALSATVKPAVATLNGLLDKVLAIPGVSEILKPAVDALKAKLATLAA